MQNYYPNYRSQKKGSLQFDPLLLLARGYIAIAFTTFGLLLGYELSQKKSPTNRLNSTISSLEAKLE